MKESRHFLGFIKLSLGLPTLLAAVALAVSGCGGSGSGSSGSGSAGSSASAIITDDLNTGFDHVWVTITAVNLTTATGSTNIYSNSTGLTVDLRALRDANGNRFLFLGTTPIPAGTYTGATVTVNNSLNIFPTGATTATAATFGGATGSTYNLALTFSSPITTTATSNDIVLDFDLANWVLTGNTVTATNNAFLSQGPASNLGDNTRWQTGIYNGSVSGLTGTAGNQSFTLTTKRYAPTVQVSSSTSLENSDGSASPVLANSQNVIVTGTFTPSTNTINATNIEIIVGSAVQSASATGAVSNINTTADTFQVTPRACDRFVPMQSALTVATTSSTLFFGIGGTTYTQADFFAALSSGQDVQVQGTESNGTITASIVTIVGTAATTGGGSGENGGTGGGNGNNPFPPNLVMIAGPTSALNATASTFTVSKTQWEGFFGQTVSTETVLYSSTTQWRQGNQNLSATQAQALIATGTSATVLGTMDATVTGQIDASRVTFSNSGGPGH